MLLSRQVGLVCLRNDPLIEASVLGLCSGGRPMVRTGAYMD